MANAVYTGKIKDAYNHEWITIMKLPEDPITKESKYFTDGQEYNYECKSYYARSRQLGRADELISKARLNLEKKCDKSLCKRTMPDWDALDQIVLEALSYIVQYFKIETYGGSTTKGDLEEMAEINYQPPKVDHLLKTMVERPRPLDWPIPHTQKKAVVKNHERDNHE